MRSGGGVGAEWGRSECEVRKGLGRSECEVREE